MKFKGFTEKKQVNNMRNEIWKDIPEYEGYYQVSNLGRIKSLTRKVKNCSGSFSVRKERFLQGRDNGEGYLIVALYKQDGSRKNIAIARLVAQVFLKDWNPDLQVDHINGDKADNRVENLRMTTNGENRRGFQKPHGISQYRGVCWHKRESKWRARITVDKKRIHLGSFEHESNAALAYDKAAIKYNYKKEALNFPDNER